MTRGCLKNNSKAIEPPMDKSEIKNLNAKDAKEKRRTQGKR